VRRKRSGGVFETRMNQRTRKKECKAGRGVDLCACSHISLQVHGSHRFEIGLSAKRKPYPMIYDVGIFG
jgi:hypothetical protein